MPSVNMIAPRRAEKKRLERDMRRLCIVIAAELALAVVVGGWACTRLLATRIQISEMDMQLTKLQPVVKHIARYNSATKALAPKLELLNQAKDRTMHWYNTLDRLTLAIPQSTYLTRLSTVSTAASSSAGSKSVLNLNGVSVSQARIGETMMRLHNVPDLESVDLHFTQKTTVDKAAAVEFEVGAGMKSTDAPEGASKNGNSQPKA